MKPTAIVTGADGFIGSHLVEMLLRDGWTVKAFCIYNSFSSSGWLESINPDLKSGLEIIFGDIRDSNCVRTAMKGCEYVFHLAALIAIPYSYVAPSSYIDTNIHGTLNVVQAAKDIGVKRVVHTSTSEVYGTAQFVPITEAHPLIGQSPYAASKIGADQIALSFWRSFDTPVSVLRPFNTYGPRQSARAVIPTIIQQVLAGSTEISLGSVTPTRDFNFVTDTCRAFIALSQCSEAIGLAVNSCSNYEISIGDTAHLIGEILGTPITIRNDSQRLRPQGSEVNRLYGDNSLLTSMTNWLPEYAGLDGLRNGLEQTIDWFAKVKHYSTVDSSKYII